MRTFKGYLLTILTLALAAAPAGALTLPDDKVGIYLFDGSGAKPDMHLFKPWKDLKLAVATKTALLQQNQRLEKEVPFEKFKLHYLFLVNDSVTRAFFLGEMGTVVMMDWPREPRSTVCMLSFAGNAGYDGGDTACK